jgi:hypothetical protein
MDGLDDRRCDACNASTVFAGGLPRALIVLFCSVLDKGKPEVNFSLADHPPSICLS